MKLHKTLFKKVIENNLFKKLILFFTLCLLTFYIHAQEIWGTTYGNLYGVGSIFKIDASDNSQLVIPFSGAGNNTPEYSSGEPHHYRMVKAYNGKYYGITMSGGEEGEGILYEFDPATGALETKANFNFYNNQGRPMGNLVEYNGKLYGTSNSLSTIIFSFDPATDEFRTETLLPSSCRGLTMVNGKFYGMTRKGGLKWAGAIFEYDPNTKVYQALYQFDHDQTGRFPMGALTHVNGKLYGVTTSGGKYSQGTLVEYDIATHHFEKKIDFKNNINGATPVGDLTYYNGKLLGSTSSGGIYNQGVLFEYDPGTGTLIKLIDFNSPSQGRFFDNINGTLYGVSTSGGSTGKGTLFTFNRDTKVYNHFHEFTNVASGNNPFGHLLFDDNKLWGMTQAGGLGNGGVIFEYDLSSAQYATPFAFNYFPLGFKPNCLAEHHNKFYGITVGGGEHGSGALFEFDPETLTSTALHHFSCGNCDGMSSQSSKGKIVFIGNTLYGITWKQSRIDAGELFSFNLTTNTYTHLHEFNDTQVGIGPAGNLTALDGKLYVTTSNGGTNNQGVLYEYDPQTLTGQVKVNLSYSTTGIELELVKNGNAIYSVGRGGYLGNGILHHYDQFYNAFVPKHTFESAVPYATVPAPSLASKGSKIYGASWPQSDGTPGNIYELDTQVQRFEIFQEFPGNNFPVNMLVISGNKLYGTSPYSQSILAFDLDDRSVTTLPELQLGSSYNEGISALLVRSETTCGDLPVLTEVVDYRPGDRKDGLPMDANRTDANRALFEADANDNPNGGPKFTSLGFGGSIIVAFDQRLCDGDGNDFRVFETSYSNPSFYDCPEQAEVFVSQDASNWTSLGVTSPANPAVGCNVKLDTDFDIQSSGMAWIRYVKVVDVTNPNAKRRNKTICVEYGGPAFNNAADGFDLDAIESLSTEPSLIARKSDNNVSREVNIDASYSRAVLYPNPVTDKLVIDLSNEEEFVVMENEMTLDILDLHGRVLHRSADAMDENWTITHDASRMTTGMYIARLKSGGVKRYYKFFKN